MWIELRELDQANAANNSSGDPLTNVSLAGLHLCSSAEKIGT